MYCLNPICIEERGIFPCGQCRKCREMRSNLWAMRMMHERGYHEKAIFVTLTYSDNFLPSDRNLSKKVAQNYIKRLRKFMPEESIKYFLCGEYGENKGRPHYHAILFGVGLGDRDKIAKAWPYGFNKVEQVSRKTCKYVTKYVCKAPLGKSRRDKLYATREPEFQLCSKGIGLRWIMANYPTIGKRGMLYHGKQTCLPRYYVDKGRAAGMSDTLLEDAKFERVLKSRAELLDLINRGMNTRQIREYHEAQRLQKIEDIRSRDSLYRKAYDDE